MTPNQREFLKIQEKIERWITAGEKKGIFFEFDVPEMPSRISKEYLQELKEMIPKKRWQFYEKYGLDVETEEPYKRPDEEIQKAKEKARKSAATRRRNKERDTGYSEPDSNVNDGAIFEDWTDRASAYMENLKDELVRPQRNDELVGAILGILDGFFQVWAGDDDVMQTFCENYETGKETMLQLCGNITDAYYEEDARYYTTSFLDLCFAGIDYEYDDSILEWALSHFPSMYGGYRNAKGNSYYG